MKYVFISLLIGCVCFGCSRKKNTFIIDSNAPMIEQIYATMSGHFSSYKQSKIDSVPHLDWHLVPLKNFKKDGQWLFSEKVNQTNKNAPIEFCVYQLLESSNQVRLYRYRIKSSHSFNKGQYQNTDFLQRLVEESLMKDTGCTLFFSQTRPSEYIAHSIGKGCVNRYKGASYVQRHLSLRNNNIYLKEQGFDEYNQFIWGQKKPFVEFERLSQ